MNPAVLLSHQLARLTAFSAVWIFAGILLALQVPWQSFPSGPSRAVVPLTLTSVLILANLALGVRFVARSGRTLDAWPSLVSFLLLFGLLFFQVGVYLGMDHFRWSRPPVWWDWLAFPLFHALLGFDLLDLLDISRLSLNTMHPAGSLSISLVLTLQLITALFAISLALDVARSARRGFRWFIASFPPAFHNVFIIPLIFGLFAVVATLVGAVTAMRSDLHGGIAADWSSAVLWFLDQPLQLIDIADLLPGLGFAIIHPPAFWWLSLTAVLLRLGAAFFLGVVLRRLGRRLSIRLFHGSGLDADDLEELYHERDDPRTRQFVFRRLVEVDFDERPALWPAGLILAGSLAVALLMLTLRPRWDDAALHLASAAITHNDDQALLTLGRLGTWGDTAAPVLGVGLRSADKERRPAFIATLACLGPRAVPVLEEVLLRHDDLACHAAEALGHIGLPAIDTLVAHLDHHSPEARSAVRAALLRLGSGAVPRISARLHRDNAPRLVPLLEEMEPRWFLLDPLEPAAREVRTARLALALLLDPQLVRPDPTYWARDDQTGLNGMQIDPPHLASHLLDLGPLVEDAVPILLDHLREERSSSGSAQYLTGLSRLGPRAREAVPELRRLLQRRPTSQEQIARALDGIDPNWRR